jgi:hypothetical protein
MCRFGKMWLRRLLGWLISVFSFRPGSWKFQLGSENPLPLMSFREEFPVKGTVERSTGK